MKSTDETRDVALIALPMHGERKLVDEGYRTRDGHIIEWAGAILGRQAAGSVCVVSRPEPILLNVGRRGRGSHRPAYNTHNFSHRTLAIPRSRDRQRWWADSAKHYRLPRAVSADVPVICWNPFAYEARILKGGRRSHFDLLDDWSIHYAFEGLWPAVKRAYGKAFDTADTVTSNSEATLELAHRYGRSDALLILNGCDPEIFASESQATGATTVGYVGKIGKRLNIDLIVSTTSMLPSFKFVFAGPILDAEYRNPLEKIPNVTLLGDVHYRDVPQLLQTFDIGWVPHNTGEGEVGGDVIKIYEYRAAGLPVLATPIIGAGSRGLADVAYLPAHDHVEWLLKKTLGGTRVRRSPMDLPSDVSWQGKAQQMLNMLELGKR